MGATLPPWRRLWGPTSSRGSRMSCLHLVVERPSDASRAPRVALLGLMSFRDGTDILAHTEVEAWCSGLHHVHAGPHAVVSRISTSPLLFPQTLEGGHHGASGGTGSSSGACRAQR